MNSINDFFDRPSVMISLGLVASACIFAAVVGGGVAVSILGEGFSNHASGIPSWIVWGAGLGVGTLGFTGGVTILIKVVKESKKQPCDWILPVLAVFSLGRMTRG